MAAGWILLDPLAGCTAVMPAAESTAEGKGACAI